jgi:pimeloyl-ACP methyl ester carboxylesterase
VFAVDHRGRGASGYGSAYSLEAELADVAAVVEAAAAAYGDRVDLLGHSFGGYVAYGAAGLTPNVRRLVLYEGWPAPNIADRVTPPKVLARLDDLLAAGALEATLEAFLRDVARASDAEIAGARTAPSWPARVAAAATIPRELRAFAERSLDAASAQALALPVLLITGATSPPAIRADPEAVAAALPDARIVELAGHGHLAHVTAPHELAAVVLAFLAAG